MRRLIRLYPAAWRQRYGDEMETLLEERPLGPFDLVDLLLGALDAHLHLRGLGHPSEHEKGITMSLRTAGIAAIVGGSFWGLTWAIVLLDQLIGAAEGNVPVAFSRVRLWRRWKRSKPTRTELRCHVNRSGPVAVYFGSEGERAMSGFEWKG